jgi:hypothetical protein
MHECDVHTLLRLPTGLFYAQGVKANVIFFDRKPASETTWTRKLWIYDLRTSKHFTLKTNPLKRADLDEFVRLYNPANRHERKATWAPNLDAGPAAGMTEGGAWQSPEGRWRCFSYDECMARDKASLDIFWLKDESLADSDNLPPPEVIAQEIVEDLEAALEQFRLIAQDLGGWRTRIRDAGTARTGIRTGGQRDRAGSRSPVAGSARSRASPVGPGARLGTERRAMDRRASARGTACLGGGALVPD